MLIKATLKALSYFFKISVFLKQGLDIFYGPKIDVIKIWPVNLREGEGAVLVLKMSLKKRFLTLVSKKTQAKVKTKINMCFGSNILLC